MTKRRANGQKKTSGTRRRWLRQLGAGVAVVVALGVVVLAVVGMTRAGGNQDTAGQNITPVAEETTEGATSRQGGPAMFFEATSVDFGDVPLNTPVSYAFPFSNTGDATLQIEDVQVKILEGC